MTRQENFTAMLSLEEYQTVIDTFMMEMQGTCDAVTAVQLQQLPKLGSEIEEFKRVVNEPSVSNESLIGLAFGLFDEFVHATYNSSIHECYDLYLDTVERKSQQHQQQ